MRRIRKGLDLPIKGSPRQKVDDARNVSRVALIGDDYVGMKPQMAVQEGDSVKLGQLLFTDKTTPGVQYTSPGCGKVVGIHRGAKRKFQSIEIQLEGDDAFEFQSYADQSFLRLSREQVRDNLVQSGLWTTLRTRPFSRVPAPDTTPHSIFVQAIDTNPLAVSPETIIAENEADFQRGLQLVSRLTDGKVFVCTTEQAQIPDTKSLNVQIERFGGPHPSGLTGTHIHLLDPVGLNKTVWSVNYQDLIAFGKLFVSGRLPTDRVISLAGPAVKDPRLLRTRIGASVSDLVDGNLVEDDVRVVSGSVLSGREANGPFAFLGRHHLQVTALSQGRERVLLEWLLPGLGKFSLQRVYASAFFARTQQYDFSTSQEGSPRAMVPSGMYERVMPLDILPTFLLRALLVGDAAQAQALGCLELDEEDLALCSYVCTGKHDYGPLLRNCLTRIEKEG